MTYYIIERYERTGYHEVAYITTDKEQAYQVQFSLSNDVMDNNYNYGMRALIFENNPDNICYNYDCYRSTDCKNYDWKVLGKKVISNSTKLDLQTIETPVPGKDHEVYAVLNIKAKSPEEAKIIATEIAENHGIPGPHYRI